MAYTPINWQTGDTITAEKMNKMDNGWGMQETQLFSESVTTVAGEYGNEAELTYANPITADSITVTFDGNEYTCPIVSMTRTEHGYGGVDSSWTYEFSQYPFAIVTNEMNGQNTFATQTAGTHTVVAVAEITEISDAFSATVDGIVAGSPSVPLKCVLYETTYAEMLTAQNAGRLMYVYVESNKCVIINSVPDDAVTGTVDYYPVTQGLTLSYNIGGKLIAQV